MLRWRSPTKVQTHTSLLYPPRVCPNCLLTASTHTLKPLSSSFLLLSIPATALLFVSLPSPSHSSKKLKRRRRFRSQIMADSSLRALLLSSVFVGLVAMAAVGLSDADPLNSTQSHRSNYPPCTWCVCKDGPDAVLQKTLDYACGHGADCNPIKPNGVCFNAGPGSLKAHCSYAVNSYYHKMNGAGGTCDFSSTATLTFSDPSSSSCSFPASASASSTGSTTPVTGVPSTPHTTPVTSTPIPGYTPKTSSPPYTATPTTGFNPSTGGLGGGVGPGYGPPGMGMYDDENKAAVMTVSSTSVALCSVLVVVALHLWK